MSASNAQRDMFGSFHKDGGGAFFQEEKSNLLREWYRRGQRAYRQLKEAGSAPQIEHFNDLMNDMHGDAREGFLMGWQSDSWADQHGKQFSIEGTTSIIQEGY